MSNDTLLDFIEENISNKNYSIAMMGIVAEFRCTRVQALNTIKLIEVTGKSVTEALNDIKTMKKPKQTYCYILPKGSMALEVEAENITEARKLIRAKHDLKTIKFDVWKKILQ